MAGSLFAASSTEPVLWSATSLKQVDQKLASRSDKKFAFEILNQFDNHIVVMVHREATGDPEHHVRQADVFLAVSGEATVLVGGEIINHRNTTENEFTGTSIQGGKRTKLGPGDVFHIPANVPHQVFVEPGQKFAYMLVKI